MSLKKIVIVEDEPDILEVLSYNLSREGFEVQTAADGNSGLALVLSEKPDMVLLDLMLPGKDGLEICQTLRANADFKSLPIIMITAKGEESDVVLGLGIGADDYIAKPFSPKELVARVKAVMRRSDISDEENDEKPIAVGQLYIDINKHKVVLNESEIKLTATEFRLLHYLASNPGRVFSREQLLDHATGHAVVVVDRNVDVHIRSIRKKIDPDQYYIETIRGVGYRFRDSE